MNIIPMKCPSCGASIQLSEENASKYIKGRCPNCKGTFIIKEAINHYNTTNNFFYDIKDSNVVIQGEQKKDFEIVGGVLKKYTGESIHPVIPDTVTIVGKGAFECLRGVKSVVIPSSVIEIEDGAFYQCKTLERVQLNDGLRTIGNRVFFECESLTSIHFPNTLLSIGDQAFEKCGLLCDITLPDCLNHLGARAFINCFKLAGNLYIPSSLKTIGEAAFSYTNISSVNLNHVENIGKWAFYGCKLLKNIRFSANLKNIGPQAFQCCDGLTQVTIPNSVETIGEYAFADNRNLNLLSVGHKVKKLPACFSCNNISLRKVILSEGLETVGNYAFYNCPQLSEVRFPSTVKSSHYVGYILDGRTTPVTAMIGNNKVCPKCLNKLGLFGTCSNNKCDGKISPARSR